MTSNGVQDAQHESADAQTESAEPESCQSADEQLRAALEQVDDLTDKYKRSVAELANYRKRQEREWSLQRTRVTMNVLEKLLPLMDDLDLALENTPAGIAEMSAEAAGWVDGIALIRRKLDGVLDGYGVKPIDAVGEPFNPHFHDALMQAPSDEYAAGVVMAEVQKGYIVGDQVLRAARVAVSSGAGDDK